MSKRRNRGLLFRVTPQGTLEPADDMCRDRLRKRRLRVNDLVLADPKKPRSVTQWRRAHKLAQLLVENIEDFHNMDPHKVLKRIQWEGNIGCDEMGVRLPDGSHGFVRIPQTLNFADMDEGEFQEVYGQMCQWVIDHYWLGMTQEQIEQMANLVGLAA